MERKEALIARKEMQGGRGVFEKRGKFARQVVLRRATRRLSDFIEKVGNCRRAKSWALSRIRFSVIKTISRATNGGN